MRLSVAFNYSDRALSNIEAIPGGMSALESMYGSILQEESALETRSGTTDESNRRFAEQLGANIETGEGPNQAALPNPWAPAPATRTAANPSGANAAGANANPFGRLICFEFLRS
jgi:ubiquilin